MVLKTGESWASMAEWGAVNKLMLWGGFISRVWKRSHLCSPKPRRKPDLLATFWRQYSAVVVMCFLQTKIPRGSCER